MDKYLQAEYIFNKLNEYGAGLGNTSIFIIKEALQDLEATQHRVQPTVLCTCKAPGFDANNPAICPTCKMPHSG